MSDIAPDGPYYDDLSPGLIFEPPPAVTLHGGLGAVYQAITGEGLRLVLDRRLSLAVTGRTEPLVSPGLVMALSTGASTVATRRVVANLFYRNVRLHRPVFEGETLETTTRVIAMADASAKPGRAPRGKVLLGIVTTADGETVLDYQRCPLIPLRGTELPGHRDELGGADDELDLGGYRAFVPQGWELEPLGAKQDWALGETRDDQLRDVVDGATAMVRLTHNLAGVHRDAEVSPYARRLVYGGHTVALAQASLTRVLAGLATIVGWHSCDHTAAVFEGDLLSFRHTLVAAESIGAGLLRAVRVEVTANRDDEALVVLDWTPVVFTN